MEGLERTSEIQAIIRRKVATLVTVCAVIMTILDIALFIYNLELDLFRDGPLPFFVQRVLTPLIVNFGLLSFMWGSEGGIHSADYKNGVVAWTICSVCGVSAIVHGVYVITWIGTGLGVLFLTISHNRLQKVLILIYSYVLVTLAFLAQLHEWRGVEKILDKTVFVYYVQNLVVCYAMLAIVYFMSMVLHSHILEIIEDNRNLMKQSGEYEQRVATDALTGCYSRDYLSHNIEKIFRKCTNRLATSMALIDIDNFKKINDTYGHDCGDVVLERIGKLGRMLGHAEQERPLYRVCRYGGEEFLFIFTDRNPVTCQKQIEEFRRVFESQEYDFTDDRITVSGGIVTCSSAQEFNVVFKAVDEALYEAKASGKNRIVVGKGL